MLDLDLVYCRNCKEKCLIKSKPRLVYLDFKHFGTVQAKKYMNSIKIKCMEYTLLLGG